MYCPCAFSVRLCISLYCHLLQKVDSARIQHIDYRRVSFAGDSVKGWVMLGV